MDIKSGDTNGNDVNGGILFYDEADFQPGMNGGNSHFSSPLLLKDPRR